MHNPGSVLQAWALQEYINKLGHDCRIIDYRPHYFYSEGNNLKHMVKNILFHREMRSRSDKFDAFIKHNMNLTSTYYSVSELDAESSTADITIAGSDQLWNTDFQCGWDDAFYLNFVKSGQLVSYSTSVGKECISEDNKKRLMQELPKFDWLSVREKSTADALSIMLQREVAFVCDPVLLLTPNDYIPFLRPEIAPNNKYAMVYLSPKCNALDRLVTEYKKLGYAIILVGGFSKRCQCDYHIKDAGPLDFLTYLYHADVVISNSFHATAFAHVFHKPFWSILPERNGERIRSLLAVSGLTDRGVNPNENIEIYNNNDMELINWANVDRNLNAYVTCSRNYLDSVFSYD